MYLKYIFKQMYCRIFDNYANLAVYIPSKSKTFFGKLKFCLQMNISSVLFQVALPSKHLWTKITLEWCLAFMHNYNMAFKIVLCGKIFLANDTLIWF
jgi:hypothetical protein